MATHDPATDLVRLMENQIALAQHVMQTDRRLHEADRLIILLHDTLMQVQAIIVESKLHGTAGPLLQEAASQVRAWLSRPIP